MSHLIEILETIVNASPAALVALVAIASSVAVCCLCICIVKIVIANGASNSKGDE